MILDKVAAKKSEAQDAGKNRSRALSLLIEEMSVLYPALYFDIAVMVSQETKGFK
ncbi:MAG: hypothetical protein PSV17_05600 [Methylotenera sp.]|uniref:hypothetical protein n=1 Tax=Methylotenera sp. TaxID=2051956 RepID=UPI002488A4A4|nr:hypothetical protein [Methylotenera sp.]MDI1308892.1 hypothetical protein [Methylotenera sp.]